MPSQIDRGFSLIQPDRQSLDQSLADTRAHISLVQGSLLAIIQQLEYRAVRHDASKLLEPEASGFAALRVALADVEYGTPEYAEALREASEVVQHHYACNDHHPEHYPPVSPDRPDIAQLREDIFALRIMQHHDEIGVVALNRIVGRLEHDLACLQSGINQMSLMGIVEMFADHRAASMRTKNGGLRRSIAHNRGRFGYSDTLTQIFENTRIELGWD